MCLVYNFAFASINVDLSINFRTAYKEGGLLVIDPDLIKQRYMRTWFILDFVSSIPFDVLSLFQPEKSALTGVNKMLRTYLTRNSTTQIRTIVSSDSRSIRAI